VFSGGDLVKGILGRGFGGEFISSH